MQVDIHAIPYGRLGRIRFLEQAERGIARFGPGETVRPAAFGCKLDGPIAHAGDFGTTSIGIKFVGEHTHG